MQPGERRDQAYYEDLAWQYALTYDIVHGVARIGTICEHDLVMDCPSGRIEDVVLFEIDADWQPEHFRLDRSLPILAAEDFETGVSAYIGLGRFPGLEFQPDVNIICDGQQAVPGWRKARPTIFHDSILEADGIDHEGLRRAIEEGAADTSLPIAEGGGFTQIDCDGPAE